MTVAGAIERGQTSRIMTKRIFIFLEIAGASRSTLSANANALYQLPKASITVLRGRIAP
jgi:hypothetical protein